jgi:hypothetical protein
MNPLAFITKLLGAGFQAQGGQIDAMLLKQQAKTSRAQGVSDADALSRDYRQLVGTQAAAMAEAGGTYTGSNAKLLSQSETLANLDRLKILYRGELRARGLEIGAEQTLRDAYIGAGTGLLSMGSSSYTRGKTMPGY